MEEETDGRLSIEVYPSSELGGIEEQVEGVSSGSIDMGHYDYSAMASMYRPLYVFNTPFIYEDTDHLLEALDPRESPVIQDMQDEMIEETNMRLIGRYYYGRRMLTCDERIEHPDDLDGKAIRVVPNDMWIAMGRGMGAQPESVEFSELPSALATGVVSGQENPLDTIIDNALHENQSHVMLTAHMRAPISITVNEDSWQQLSDEDQETVYNLMDELGQETVDRGLEREEELLVELQEDEGTEVVGSGELGTEEEFDRNDFREPVQEEVEEEFDDLVSMMDQIRDMA
nr:TRAP transporter substrate-binding protein [Natronococcus sp. CG52]